MPVMMLDVMRVSEEGPGHRPESVDPSFPRGGGGGAE